MMKRASILVSGRVQGVFFRDHTRRWASGLGLTGWVKNRTDGGVEVLAEGREADIRALLAKLSQGPPMSRVDDVRVEWAPFQGEYDDFRVTW